MLVVDFGDSLAFASVTLLFLFLYTRNRQHRTPDATDKMVVERRAPVEYT